MAQQIAVSYAVNMTGNLPQQAQQAANAVQNLGSAAQKAMPHLGGLTMAQSNMVSQAETVISMFGQMGGAISQVSILASSGIRPFAMLAANIGIAGAAALGLGAVAGIAAVAGLVKLTNASLQLAEAAGEAGARLEELGLITGKQASFARDMAEATAAAEVAQDQFTVGLAESIGVVGQLSQAWTGLNVVLAEQVTKLGEAGEGFRKLRHEAADFIGHSVSPGAAGDNAAGWMKWGGDLMAPGGGHLGMNPVLNAALDKLAEKGREAAEELERAKRARDELLIYGPEAPEHLLEKDTYGPDLPPGMGIYGKPPKTAKRKGPTAADMALFARQERYDADIARAGSAFAGQVSFDDPLLPAMDANTKAQLEANLIAQKGTAYTQEQIEAADNLREALEQADATARANRGLGALGAALSGDMNQVVGFGLQQAGLAGDPVMMATSMILQALPDLQETLGGMFEQVFDTYTNLDDIIGGIASELVPEMIRSLPEMMAAFVTLAPAIVAELIVAAPLIFEAVIDAIVELPSAIANAIVDVLDPFGVVHTTGKGERNPTGSKVGAVIGGILGTPFGPPGVIAGAAAGAAVGGSIEGGGGRGRVDLSSRTSRGPVTIVNNIKGDTRQGTRELRRTLGTYGWNETIEGPV